MRDVLLIISAVAVAAGFLLLSIPVGLVVAGLLLGAFAYLSE